MSSRTEPAGPVFRAAFRPSPKDVRGDRDFSTLSFPALGEGADGAHPARAEERARLEEQWRARGHAAGYADGLRAADAAVTARVAALEAEHSDLMSAVGRDRDRALALVRASVRALDERTVPVLRDAEDALLEAAFALAEAIVGHVLADESRAARFALARAGDEAAGSHTVAPTVRLHPLDVVLLGEHLGQRCGVVLVADASLDRGDAVSEFPDGFLDARIGSALARARAALEADPA